MALPEASVAWLNVPPTVPGPLFLVRTTETPGTGLLAASATCTTTGGVMAAPEAALPGCWVKLMAVGVPAVMAKALLAVGGALPLVAVSCLPAPARSTLRSANVAVPVPSVSCVAAPLRRPAPAVSASVTGTPGTELTSASTTCTTTGGAIAAPDAALLGWVVKTTLAAAPAVTAKGALVPKALRSGPAVTFAVRV